MRFTVQYIPLNKIKSDGSVTLNERLKKLRTYIWDCMHLIAVRRNKKDGSYTLLSGHDRYLYLRDHTKKHYAPCIVDENNSLAEIESWLTRLLKGKEASAQQSKLSLPLLPSSWHVIRTFVKQEPRFSQLPRRQQIKVIFLAIRAKRTVVNAMKAKVDEFMS